MSDFWPLGAAAVAFLVLLGLYRRLRRRSREGQVTEVERRFDATLGRWKVEIDRFKFTRQGAVKTLLNHDHAIGTHIEELAASGEEDRVKLRIRASRYVEEIVPFFRPLAYYSFGARFARWVLNTLYALDYRPEEVDAIKAYSQERPRSVIYLANHRSNVDYVLMAYVLADRVALSFAVGEWARVWPLEYLFKAFGSYFLRRGFRDPLYHTVLRRYVQLVTKNAVTQALFPEGGLSRDGRLRSPKIGLVDNIILSKQDRSFRRELIFVPVAINYDRVLEDRVLVAERGSQRPKAGKLDGLRRVVEILFGNARKLARHQIRRNGIAAVRFGEPVSFDAWHEGRGVDIFSLSKEGRRQHVAEFCNEMMERIAKLVPVTPLCLVARSLLAHAPLDRPSLEQAVTKDIETLEQLGCEVVWKEKGVGVLVDGALLRFGLRHLIKEEQGVIELVPEHERVLRYYAESVVHFEEGEVPRVETPTHLGSSEEGARVAAAAALSAVAREQRIE